MEEQFLRAQIAMDFKAASKIASNSRNTMTWRDEFCTHPELRARNDFCDLCFNRWFEAVELICQQACCILYTFLKIDFSYLPMSITYF